MPRRGYNGRRNTRRTPQRKFVWARTQHIFAVGSDQRNYGVDLLQQFQQEYGAQLLGATVVRIRGFILPFMTETFAGTVSGTSGIIVDSNDADFEVGGPNDGNNNTPLVRDHDDWLAWLPWAFTSQATTGYIDVATWNQTASPWAVDIKSSRKIEELGETLWMFNNMPANVGLNSS